ncbi:MAG: hypothetical protein CR982_05915 [Candidatus Cloacimonadota bacterium]|nr:MAG: hypothetical protein CR982_05915 [Candidatus Cloacimonadota bacterium]PIE78056.1 MAG: hypothetical protein CSA15_09475 [Candidatus Delongbacteria bacterium]
MILISYGQFEKGFIVSGIGTIILGLSNLFLYKVFEKFKVEYRKGLYIKLIISLVCIGMIISPYMKWGA